MNIIKTIALNTFKEIIRDRILYALVVFALLLVGLSLALGQLSFSEQSRISANFGFTAMHLSSVILAIFVGSTLVSKEIDKKTVLTLLVRPISRMQFLLGKALGLILIIVVIILGLSVIMLFIFKGLNVSIGPSFLITVYGILLEAIVLLGISLFFSSFSSAALVVSFSIGVFLIGHWLGSLEFFANKSNSEVFSMFSLVINNIFPDLEKFNWRSLVVYKESVPAKELLLASLYSFSWFGFLMAITNVIFKKKEFN